MFSNFFRVFAKRRQAFKILEIAHNLEKEGKIKEAIILCQEVVNQNPRNVLFRVQLGMLEDALILKEGPADKAVEIACRPFRVKR